MKLSQEQIDEIIELKEKGISTIFLAEKFEVTPRTIYWNLNPIEHRKKMREYQKKWYNRLSKKQKKKMFARKREYQRKYHRERYASDPEFRKIQLERSNNYKRIKALEIKP